MKSVLKRCVPGAALILSVLSAPAFADEAADVAREMHLPASVVANVFTNVDAYVASADAPANRLMTGVIKETVLKAVRSRLGSMDDSGPGKASESSAEEDHAVYKAQIRTTRRDSTETGECVENKVQITASEALPVVKEGSFTFDTVHPRVTGYSWPLSFCRSRGANGDFSDWQLAK